MWHLQFWICKILVYGQPYYIDQSAPGYSGTISGAANNWVYTGWGYNKLYPNKNVVVNNGHDYGSQKKCLGFENGPITFFVGDIVKNESFFDQWIDARYHVLWGWYVINGIDISNITLPKNVYPVELNWQSVGDENGYLKSKEEIQKTIRKIAKIVKESL